MSGPLLVLVGPPASGKTTVGTAVAEALDVGFRDTDRDVEVGDGLETARRRGSVAHDEIELTEGRVQRLTDRAGGIEGGMTNGEVLRVRAAMKPISTVPRALATVDTATLEPAVAINQRSDACAVPRGSVVMEAMVALVLADAVLEKFGGDSVAETRRNAQSYLDALTVR